MPVQVTRLSDEPILHALFTGTIIEQDLLYMFAQSLALTEDMPDSQIYRITEARDPDINFTEVMLILRDMSDGSAGSTTDPRFQPVLVGTDENMELIATASFQEQYGHMDLLLFGSFDDALAYVREIIATA